MTQVGGKSMGNIKRDYYLNQIVRNMWNGEVKVITGLRRCGKSTLLFELFSDYLTEEQGFPKDRIIKIELDKRKDYKFRDPITLCEHVEAIVTSNEDAQYYLFIDEVQLTKKIVDKENDNNESKVHNHV